MIDLKHGAGEKLYSYLDHQKEKVGMLKQIKMSLEA